MPGKVDSLPSRGDMVTVFLSLGSNVGNRRSNICKMIDRLCCLLHPPRRISCLMETEPVDVALKQRWFYNCVLSGKYRGTLQKLLAQCLSIESDLGRVRKKPHAPRTADIDILLYGNRRIVAKDLAVPHRQVLRRRFCLEGLREIAPARKFPGTGISFARHYGTMAKRVKAQKIAFLPW